MQGGALGRTVFNSSANAGLCIIWVLMTLRQFLLTLCLPVCRNSVLYARQYACPPPLRNPEQFSWGNRHTCWVGWGHVRPTLALCRSLCSGAVLLLWRRIHWWLALSFAAAAAAAASDGDDDCLNQQNSNMNHVVSYSEHLKSFSINLCRLHGDHYHYMDFNIKLNTFVWF